MNKINLAHMIMDMNNRINNLRAGYPEYALGLQNTLYRSVYNSIQEHTRCDSFDEVIEGEHALYNITDKYLRNRRDADVKVCENIYNALTDER